MTDGDDECEGGGWRSRAMVYGGGWRVVDGGWERGKRTKGTTTPHELPPAVLPLPPACCHLGCKG